MRAVIQSWPPKSQMFSRVGGLAVASGGGDQDAMGGRFVAVVILAAQPAADLRLADAAVAQDDQLTSLTASPPAGQVLEVRADRAEAMLSDGC